MESKRKGHVESSSDDDDDFDLGQIIKFKEQPVAPTDSGMPDIKTERVYFTPDDGKQRLMVLLDNAGLELGRTKTDFQLLSFEEHENLIRKMKRDP